jgi:hypothetical protein
MAVLSWRKKNYQYCHKSIVAATFAVLRRGLIADTTVRAKRRHRQRHQTGHVRLSRECNAAVGGSLTGSLFS